MERNTEDRDDRSSNFRLDELREGNQERAAGEVTVMLQKSFRIGFQEGSKVSYVDL